MRTEIRFEDREYAIECLRLALNMCEIGVNYQQAELIDMVVREWDILGGHFTVDDAFNLLNAHKEKWDKYFNGEK